MGRRNTWEGLYYGNEDEIASAFARLQYTLEGYVGHIVPTGLSRSSLCQSIVERRTKY